MYEMNLNCLEKNIWKWKGSRITKTILKNRTELEDSHNLTSVQSYRNQDSMAQCNIRIDVYQWNRLKSPGIVPYVYVIHLFFFFLQGFPNDPMRKEQSFIKYCWAYQIFTCEEWSSFLLLHPTHKIHLKWVIDLKVKSKTINVIPAYVGVNLCDL